MLKQAEEAFFAIADESVGLSARLMAAVMAGSDNDEGDVRCTEANNIASDSAHIVVQGRSCTKPSLSISVKGTGTEEAVEALETLYEEVMKKPPTCPAEVRWFIVYLILFPFISSIYILVFFDALALGKCICRCLNSSRRLSGVKQSCVTTLIVTRFDHFYRFLTPYFLMRRILMKPSPPKL